MADEHFDAVVVGSGFGGSVAAYRLREAGLSVCLLERGRPYPPGSFPRSPAGARDNFWDPSEGLYGLFDLWSFRGFEALVSSGLGGGSLIYANVLLRKDERWFVREDPNGLEYWPVTRADLEPHYDNVERMMRPQRYPLDTAPYDRTAKTIAFRQAAHELGLQWGLPPLAVLFGNPDGTPAPGVPVAEAHPNLHGRPRFTCILCGECDIGCNYGSKNTLDYTYLSAAKRLGAAIRTGCEVRTFAPRQGGGFSVEYVEHSPERQGRRTETAGLPRVTITADRLVLSAGTLGSTFLLFKNGDRFPALSRRLGTHFCGNGDLLGFFLRARDRTTGHPRPLEASRGPVITCYVRVPDELDGAGARGRGFYIEDGGHPDLMGWLAEVTQVPGLARRLGGFLWRRLRARLSRSPKSAIGGEVKALLGSCALSSGSLPVLGMGRDIPDGTMKLRDGYLDVDWTTATSMDYFRRLRGTMKEMADALGADFRDNPIWYFRRVITVHPVGGCPMGRSDAEGVVDGFGRAFNYPGLYVADGSVMPGPVGANPSLTIAAMADRTADAIIADHKQMRR